MADDITVVRVKDAGDGLWGVEFSDPVIPFPEGYGFKPGTKWIACSDDDAFDHLKTDELGAFVWGLKTIKKHKERQNAQDA